MKFNRLYISIVLLVAVLLAANFSFAASNSPPAATVVAIRGEINAYSDNSPSRRLKVKSVVFENETIMTGKRGRIQLLFRDSTIISLGRNSEMKISEYTWQPEDKNGSLKTNVKEGTFRVMGGAITRFTPEKFTTETPTATIGIRGSMYAGTVTVNSLSVVFQGGKGIDITNPAGTVAISKPGFGTHVFTADKPPLTPVKFSASDLAALNSELTGDLGPDQEEEQNPEAQQQEEGQPDQDKEQADEGGDQPPEDEASQQENEQEQQEGPEATTDSDTGNDSGQSADAGEAQPSEGPDSADNNGTPPPDDNQAAPPVETAPPPVEPTAPPPVSPTPVPVPPPYVPPQGGDPTPIPTPTIPTVSLPTDGVGKYKGTYTLTKDDGTETGSMFMEVNWHAGKAFGLAFDETLSDGSPAFFYGTVNGTSLINVRVFGSDGGGGNGPSAFKGTGNGSFLGSIGDLFDVAIIGNDYSISDPSALPSLVTQGSWSVKAGMSKESDDQGDAIAPQGAENWQGWGVGISENVNAISDRKLFMTTTGNAFLMTVNKDNGTVNGTLQMTQLNPYYTGNINLTLGGSYGSAYVLNDAFIAEIGCSGNCVDDDTGGGYNTALNQVGNYLFTENPDNQLSEYMTWGYWEISHHENDPDTSLPGDSDTDDDMYHTHIPYSMWVAGKLTTSDYIDDLTANANGLNFSGHYSGFARGSQVTSGGVMYLPNGTVDLTVDFANAASVSAITGNIFLRDDANTLVKTLHIDSYANEINKYGESGFTAFFDSGSNPGISSGPDPNHNIVKGSLYGDRVQNAGGSFTAEFSTETYLGIFGGNLTNGPAPENP